MSEFEPSPTRQSRYLDDPRNSRRNSLDLRQHALLSTTIPSLASGQEWHRNPVFAPPASLLNSRRSSMVSLSGSMEKERGGKRGRAGRAELAEAYTSSVVTEPASPEDGSNFRRSLQIDMRGLVGDAVGNMSISPASRDVVLAARRGLFIIDLEAPLEVPRFLPQGGTWDVADVQWNPHPSRAEYIVSTSSEKLLIWNLLLVGKTSIEFILQAHYRAITDINWHTTECDTVISTGIDSWLWAWDLREPKKPIFGLSAFESGGTQVKWNRQDGNIIASSHSNEVLIWDRRNGSLPINRIKAHTSKIYGIDWAHDRRDELVTCSLDKTIKVWNTSTTSTESDPGLKTTIRTAYPVWRARNLPFGCGGVLSLAQRGTTALEMYAQGRAEAPVERFEGHTDVVKEFVWRRGGEDEFQLITWSKDRTLRFWPVEPEVMQQVGHTAPPKTRPREGRADRSPSANISYRNPPEGTGYLPLLSAPVGHRSILAEVRAPLPPFPPIPSLPHARSQGGTMSRGNPNPNPYGGAGRRGRVPMDAFTWLSNVKLGERERVGERERRGSSEGVGAVGGGESAEVSRLRGLEADVSTAGEELVIGEMDVEREKRRRSESRVRVESEVGQNQNQSLQDEITSVISKFAPSKVKLEKHDLTKKRTCTLGLHGPWGGTSSVFIRVTFTFPRDYPQASYPGGTPIVELERNPLITLKDRAFMLRRLTAIREHRRPCLESCLRFLLFRDEEERPGEPLPIDPETSSSDEEDAGTSVGGRKAKDATVTVLRGNKNLVEPRTSQGTFGPNGELVCFFRAPTRIVRNVLRGLSDSPATPSEEPASATPASAEPPPAPRMFQSPSLISDAVRRLGLSAKDRHAKTSDAARRLGDRHNILRIMTNLLTLQPKPKSSSQVQAPDGEGRPLGDLLKSYALLAAPRRSTVFIENTTNIAGGDRKVAVDYVFGEAEGVGRVAGTAAAGGGGLKEVCGRNARAARVHGRYDHERAFKMLQALLPAYWQATMTCDTLALSVIMGLYDDFAKNKDIQMLAMLSVLLLQIHGNTTSKPATTDSLDVGMDLRTAMHKFTAVDYFNLGRSLSPPNERPPAWPRRPSPPTMQQQQLAASLSSSNSSRGSWSNLFNSGSVRQFMTGVQDTLLSTPLETPAMTTVSSNSSAPCSSSGPTESASPVLKLDKMNRVTEGRRKKQRKDQPRPPVTAATPPVVASKSWNETQSQSHPVKLATSFSSAGHRRTPLAQVNDPSNTRAGYKRTIVFEPPQEQIEERPGEILTEAMLEQLRLHVHVYADLLCRWQLYHKRLELLKAAKGQITPSDMNRRHTIGLIRTCTRCAMALPRNVNHCPSCSAPSLMAKCTICRLPVKGLSRSCLQCFHVTHLSCWNTLDVPLCPTGCGCFCTGLEDMQTRPSSRHGPILSPPSTNLVLSSFA